jgi:hypothetical protein
MCCSEVIATKCVTDSSVSGKEGQKSVYFVLRIPDDAVGLDLNGKDWLLVCEAGRQRNWTTPATELAIRLWHLQNVATSLQVICH